MSDSINYDKIFDAAEHVLVKMKDHPEIFVTDKDGGHMTILDGRVITAKQIGNIPQQSDVDYETKDKKYYQYAREKCVVISSEKVLTSKESSLNIAGGLRVNDRVIVAFSGRPEMEDELLVVVIMLRCKMIDIKLVNTIKKISKNPYLTASIIKLLVKN